MIHVHQIQKQAQEIVKYIDLYGNELLFKTLKQYPFVSWTNKTIPKQGSPTRLTRDIELKKTAHFKVHKLVAHKDGKTTVFTDKGVYQFFAAGQEVKPN